MSMQLSFCSVLQMYNYMIIRTNTFFGFYVKVVKINVGYQMLNVGCYQVLLIYDIKSRKSKRVNN